MKRILISILLFSAGCTTSPNAPMSPSYHPFPRTFKQVTVLYRNIPEQWSSQNDSWQYDPITKTKTGTYFDDSGTSLFSGIQSLSFSNSNFTQSGDTIKLSYFDVVVDSIAGQVQWIHYSRSGQSSGGPGGWGYTLDCRNLPYTTDSINRTVAFLSGASLQTGLHEFDTGWSEGANMELSGSIQGGSRSYTGFVSDSASITIQFSK